jgi:putative PIN family toxin of toxin-antitoxin system
MKIVIDTNLLIDGASDDYNYGNRIIEEVLAGRMEAYANSATLRENRLLSRKKISDEHYLEKLNEFFSAVQPSGKVSERIRIVSDPEDNKLIESAVASGAEYLISSDKHLLDIGEYEGISIVSPADFWHKYQDNTTDPWSSWVNNFIKQ